MAKRDYYQVLGVTREASAEDIKRAFREIAKKHHPDRNPGNKESEETLKSAAEAYSVLSDPEKKQMYDRFGAEGPGMAGFRPGAGFGSIEDIFSAFGGDLFEEIFGGFGGRGGRRGARRGADLQMEIELTYLEAAKGVTREVELTKPTACETCGGSGAKPGTSPTQCPTCRGRGVVSTQQGFFAFSATCGRCGGQGTVVAHACETCRGAGAVRKKKRLKVEIPAGVDDGNRVQIGGEGEAGAAGGPPGDLYLRIRLKEHELFSREDEHLLCQVPIGFAQAALGATLSVPTLEGEKPLTIPAGTQSGDTFVIKGAGFPRPGRGSSRGDEIVQVLVVTPRKLSPEQKQLLEELGKTENVLLPAEAGLLGRFKKKFRGK